MSSNVRRRRRTVEERLGAAVRHLRPGDLAGRGEPLPRDRGASRVSGGRPGEDDRGVHIEHVTLQATASQTIASGGAGVEFDRIAGPPTERVGFETLSARIATGGVVAIPVDVRGLAQIQPDLFFRESSTFIPTVRVTRDGTELDDTFFEVTESWFNRTWSVWVRPGDTITVTLDHSQSVTGFDDAATGFDAVVPFDGQNAVTILHGQIVIDVWEQAQVTSDTEPPNAVYRAVVMADGPVAYWRLGESSGSAASDETDNGYDGTYVGSPTLGQTGVMLDGYGDTSVAFSGSSQYATMGDVPLDFAGRAAYTVEAWVYPSTTAGTQLVVAKEQFIGGGDKEAGWALMVVSGAASGHRGSSSFTEASATGGTVTAGVSNHLVYTYDGTNMRVYVNGALVAGPTASTLSLPDSTYPVVIGARSDATFPFKFNGRIDEVAIYDRALTAAEISEHYTVGAQEPS